MTTTREHAPTGRPPATYGASEHGLRNDYSEMGADYTVEQRWDDYSAAQHDRWRRLYQRQISLVPGRACDEYIDVVHTLDYDTGIPRFSDANARLTSATGWQLVGVPGLLPEHVFFEHLANRRFPVTVWLREESEFDYIVEPDVFHDFFGHVPLLFNPVFADYMQAYGRGGLKAEGLAALKYLARLYWYTVEFGLIDTAEGLRIYGAGVLSSPSEIAYALDSAKPQRLRFVLRRVMCSRYKIDKFQQAYFVIDDFEQLFAETRPDFTPIYREVEAATELAANEHLDSDRIFA